VAVVAVVRVHVVVHGVAIVVDMVTRCDHFTLCDARSMYTCKN
jgi:hypothetical protein